MLTIKSNFIIAIFAILITHAAVADTVKILPLGDSITAGDGPDGAEARPSYRRDLWDSLIDAGYDVDFVGSRDDYTNTTIPAVLQDFDPDYEGWPGETAAQINSALNTRMAGYTPDIALVHVGTNDILASSYNPAQDDAVILSEIGGIVSKLRIKNPNIIILLAKIIPIGDNNSDAENFNSKLENEISVYNNTAPSSPSVVLVDQHSDMIRPDDYWDTSIHPSESGEQKMASQWFNHLTQQQKLSDNQSGDVTENVPVTNGLTLWLDASDVDANNIVDAVSTSEVPVWKDKSGSDNDVSQIDGVGAPSILANELNSLPTLDFFEDGLIAPDNDQITADESYTKFVVFKFDTEEDNNLISSSETAFWEGDSGAIRVWHTSSDYVMTSVNNIIDRSLYHIAATRYGQPDDVDNVLNLNGVDVNIKPVNSEQGHEASATSIGSFSDGNFNLDGKIAEALIFNRALTNAEISQIESYLSNKWGLPLGGTPAGDADAAISTISANASSVIANGSSTATITVQAKDANGINLNIGGDDVTISSTGSASLSSVTDNGNGTYTATISSNTTGVVTISATLNSVEMTNTTGLLFTDNSNNNSGAYIIPILQILLLDTEQ
ncbi:MAG: invasin domain 3-containing protein [Cocleimonas sp.]